MKIFILEDSESRIRLFKIKLKNHTNTFAKTVKEARKILMNDKNWDIMLLDHDLGEKENVPSEEEETGYQVAVFIRKNDIKSKQIIIHSFNPVGAERMQQILPGSIRIPFSTLIEKVF
jgi:hypothetical protein